MNLENLLRSCLDPDVGRYWGELTHSEGRYLGQSRQWKELTQQYGCSDASWFGIGLLVGR